MIFFVDRPTNRGSWNLTTKQKCYTIVKSCHKLKKIQACGLNAVTRQNPNFLYRLKKIYLLGKRPYFFMIRWLLMNTSHIQAIRLWRRRLLKPAKDVISVLWTTIFSKVDCVKQIFGILLLSRKSIATFQQLQPWFRTPCFPWKTQAAPVSSFTSISCSLSVPVDRTKQSCCKKFASSLRGKWGDVPQGYQLLQAYLKL
jgi:hypothetical protein